MSPAASAPRYDSAAVRNVNDDLAGGNPPRLRVAYPASAAAQIHERHPPAQGGARHGMAPSTILPEQPHPTGCFAIVLRTWAGGRLVDEQQVARADSFERATQLARRWVADRVRLNNSDVTISIEPAAGEQG